MNLMNKWVKMVNEQTYNFPEENPDEISNEKGIMQGDDYEKFQREKENLLANIEKTNAEYEKKHKPVTEAEEEDAESEGESDPYFDSDDYKHILDGFDELMNGKTKSEEPEYVNIHNQMSELYKKGLDNKENKNKYNALLKQLKKFMGGDEKEDVEDEPKSYFVSGTVRIFKPKATKDQVEKIMKSNEEDSKEMLENLPKPEIEKDENILEKFEDEKSAAAFVAKKMAENGLKPAQFKKLHDKEDVKLTLSKGNARTMTVNAIPQSVKSIDPNAFGWVYTSTEGEGKKFAPGPRTGSNGEDNGNYTYDKIDKQVFIEFILYKSTKPANFDGGFDDFFEAWCTENIPGYTEEMKRKEEEKKARYEAAMKEMSELKSEYEEELKNSYVTQINNSLAKMPEDAVDSILKPVFPDKTREERVYEIGIPELEELRKGQLWRIIKRIDGYLAQEFAQNSKEEVKIMSDDEIKAAFDAEQNGTSVDGYESRGDETKADKQDREDAKREKEEREEDEKKDAKADKIENDTDDYESEQDFGGNVNTSFSQIRGQGSTTQKASTTTRNMWGVPVTDKEFRFLNDMVDRKDWPKNAEEVKALKKRVKEETAE